MQAILDSELKKGLDAGEEKLYHEWGQTGSGIADVLRWITSENDLT